MLILLPMAGGLLPLFGVWLAGGFEDFVWIGESVTPSQAFGILGAICYSVAALLYVRTQSDTILGGESVGWPTVPGRLEEWEVRPYVTAYLGKLNAVTARYSYELDGEPYEGELMAFGPHRLKNSDALDRVRATYRRGMDVTLRHAPDQPDLAVLVAGDAFARERLPYVWGLLAAPVVLSILVALFQW
jgi:hypothetical protein